MLVVFFQLGPGKKGCSKEPNAKMLGGGGATGLILVVIGEEI